MRQFLIFASQHLIEGREISPKRVLAKKDEWMLTSFMGRKILIITGTRGVWEWASNIFQGGWERSAKEIKSEYEQYHPFGKPDYIIGYSRGGVLGLYLAEAWDCRCVAFSCPRVSAKNLDLRYVPLFIEASHDIIAMIPPWYLKPIPHVVLQVPGWKHSVAKVEKIPIHQIEQVASMLRWDTGPYTLDQNDPRIPEPLKKRHVIK
jgi:hypothetical protein